jgi:uncharacterized delta-60 repeat protein
MRHHRCMARDRLHTACMRREVLAVALVACGGGPLPVSIDAEVEPALPSCVGLLDPAFGSSGVVVTGNDVPLMIPRAAAFDAADRLFVVGQTSEPPKRMAIARFTSDGMLDTTWSADGLALPVLGDEADAVGVAVDSDGTVLVTGTIDGVAVLARFTPDGELDGTFAGGYVHLGASVPMAIELTDAGIVVAANAQAADGTVAFYRRDRMGAADATFGTNGTAQDYFSHGSMGAFSVDPSGRFLAAFNGSATGVTRYTANGGRDATFGASAGSAFPFITANGFAGIMGQSSGRTILAANDQEGVMMIGLLEYGAPDSGATDTTYGYVRLPVDAPMRHMVRLPNDSVLLTGDIARHLVGIRVTANGQYDGCWVTDKVGTAAAAAVDSQGRFTIVGHDQVDSQLARVVLARLVP